MSDRESIRQYMDELTQQMKDAGFHADEELEAYGTTYLNFVKYQGYHRVEVNVEYTDECNEFTPIRVAGIMREKRVTRMSVDYVKPKDGIFDVIMQAVEDAMNPNYLNPKDR